MRQEIGNYFNPVLAAIKSLGGSARPAEVYAKVAEDMQVSEAVLQETLADGRSRFEKKIAFVRLYLVLTGYIDKSRRGVWTLTERGRDAGRLSDEEIDKLLWEVQGRGEEPPQPGDTTSGSALSLVEDTDEKMAVEETDYASQLLNIIRTLPPDAFERLCQRLLRESGFDQVTVTGRSGDNGIDGNGVLRVNPFVAFRVLFQCKRYRDGGAVRVEEVRDFRGAMEGRADKGIFLTTGRFTGEAQKEAVRDGARPIELVDGERLVELFEEFELGLKPRTTYDVDVAFFDQFRSHST